MRTSFKHYWTADCVNRTNKQMRYLSSKDGETQMHVETSSKQRCKDRRARMMRRDWQQHAGLTTAHQPTAYQRVGTRPGGHCDTWPSRIVTDYHKTKLFCWWNVFHVLCRMGRWSVWSWFDVNRSNFDDDMRQNRFLHFSFPVTLTFDL